MTQFSSFLNEIIQVAASTARSQFGQVTGHTKPEDQNQVLTQTDLEIGRQMIELITAQFPSHNLIDEEAGVTNNHSDFTWVVDPIDGTSNFASGVPTYGTMVGLLFQNQPIAGAISLPSLNQFWVAEKGQGCRNLNHQLVQVSTQTQLDQVLIGYGIDGHPEDPARTQKEGQLITQIVLACRNLRTSNSVFDVAMVATGGYGAILNQTSKVWDNVAQEVIVTEAGGTYTDFGGKPMNYSQALTNPQRNYTYCAGSPAIHAQLQAILAV